MRIVGRWAVLRTVVAISLACAASATARPLTFPPKFRHVAGTSLLASGHYVFISGGRHPAGTGVLTDDRKLGQQTITAPGCKPSALGGQWIAFTCGAGTDQTFELFNMATGQRRVLTVPSQYQDCSIDCIETVAIGTGWVGFEAPPPGHHFVPVFLFQNIDTGDVVSDPTAATTNIDLSSPGLSQAVARR